MIDDAKNKKSFRSASEELYVIEGKGGGGYNTFNQNT
jgi:hypothetical protein